MICFNWVVQPPTTGSLGEFQQQRLSQRCEETHEAGRSWKILQLELILLMVQKSGDHQLRLVVYPIISKGFKEIPGGWGWDF